MDNLRYYNQGREVPKEAQKEIKGGRINGFTDINPMWRIRVLTEMFGPCGIGWYYTIDREWLEPSDTGEVAAFVRISLFVKDGGEWSMPIIGVGGSTFVAQERNGLRMSDEAFKMAQTDALSVACKNLGIGATIYWAAGETKYSRMTDQKEPEKPKEYKCCDCGKPFTDFTSKAGKTFSAGQMYHMAESANTDGRARCRDCAVKAGTRKDKEETA
jgi:DNA-directed RNA polymerase subunit RPC12/RpoP